MIKKSIIGVLKKVTDYIDDILLLSGVTLLSIGVFKIYIPAGFISLGVCLIAFAFFYASSRAGDHN